MTNADRLEIIEALQLLSLSKGVDVTGLKKKYRELAQQHHPDKGGNAEDFAKVHNAYKILLEKGTVYPDIVRLTHKSVLNIVRK